MGEMRKRGEGSKKIIEEFTDDYLGGLGERWHMFLPASCPQAYNQVGGVRGV